jgi:hypothetical protein
MLLKTIGLDEQKTYELASFDSLLDEATEDIEKIDDNYSLLFLSHENTCKKPLGNEALGVLYFYY